VFPIGSGSGVSLSATGSEAQPPLRADIQYEFDE